MVDPRPLPVRPIIGFVLAPGAVAPDHRTRSTERMAARSSRAESGEHPDACPGAPKPPAHRYSGWLGRHRSRRSDAGRSVRPSRCALAYPVAASRRLRSSRAQGPLPSLRASLKPMSHRERSRTRCGTAWAERTRTGVRGGALGRSTKWSAAATQTIRDLRFTPRHRRMVAG